MPAIDFGPPPQRGHVTCKLKKLQREGERRSKIEEDNFRLLQRMGDIMKKNRLDNYWETQPPTFLRRVGIYHRTRSPSPYSEVTPASTPETPLTRKSRCTACTPVNEKPRQIPEERIPWEPPKKSVSRRRSSSVALPLTSDFDFSRKQSSRDISLTRSHPVSAASKTRAKSSISTESGDRLSSKRSQLPSISSKRSKSASRLGSEQRLVVQQGALQVAVNFPSYAEVKLTSDKGEKFLQRSHCECGAIKSESKSQSNITFSD